MSVVVSGTATLITLSGGSRFPISGRLHAALPFLLAWTVAAVYVCCANLAERRRERSLDASSIAYGIPLRKAGWVLLSDAFAITQLGAMIGACAGAVGHVGLAIGAMSVAAALAIAVWRTELMVGVRAVAFEVGGLRVYARGYELFFPWKAIVGIDRAGKGTRQLLLIKVSNKDDVLRTLNAETHADRNQVGRFLFDLQGRLIVGPWIGGLSAGALERALGEARSADGTVRVN